LIVFVSSLIILIWGIIDSSWALSLQGIVALTINKIGLILIYGLMFGCIALFVARTEN